MRAQRLKQRSCALEQRSCACIITRGRAQPSQRPERIRLSRLKTMFLGNAQTFCHKSTGPREVSPVLRHEPQKDIPRRDAHRMFHLPKAAQRLLVESLRFLSFAPRPDHIGQPTIDTAQLEQVFLITRHRQGFFVPAPGEVKLTSIAAIVSMQA